MSLSHIDARWRFLIFMWCQQYLFSMCAALLLLNCSQSPLYISSNQSYVLRDCNCSTVVPVAVNVSTTSIVENVHLVVENAFVSVLIDSLDGNVVRNVTFVWRHFSDVTCATKNQYAKSVFRVDGRSILVDNVTVEVVNVTLSISWEGTAMQSQFLPPLLVVGSAGYVSNNVNDVGLSRVCNILVNIIDSRFQWVATFAPQAFLLNLPSSGIASMTNVSVIVRRTTAVAIFNSSSSTTNILSTTGCIVHFGTSENATNVSFESDASRWVMEVNSLYQDITPLPIACYVVMTYFRGARVLSAQWVGLHVHLINSYVSLTGYRTSFLEVSTWDSSRVLSVAMVDFTVTNVVVVAVSRTLANASRRTALLNTRESLISGINVTLENVVMSATFCPGSVPFGAPDSHLLTGSVDGYVMSCGTVEGFHFSVRNVSNTMTLINGTVTNQIYAAGVTVLALSVSGGIIAVKERVSISDGYIALSTSHVAMLVSYFQVPNSPVTVVMASFLCNLITTLSTMTNVDVSVDGCSVATNTSNIESTGMATRSGGANKQVRWFVAFSSSAVVVGNPGNAEDFFSDGNADPSTFMFLSILLQNVLISGSLSGCTISLQNTTSRTLHQAADGSLVVGRSYLITLASTIQSSVSVANCSGEAIFGGSMVAADVSLRAEDIPWTTCVMSRVVQLSHVTLVVSRAIFNHSQHNFSIVNLLAAASNAPSVLQDVAVNLTHNAFSSGFAALLPRNVSGESTLVAEKITLRYYCNRWSSQASDDSLPLDAVGIAPVGTPWQASGFFANDSYVEPCIASLGTATRVRSAYADSKPLVAFRVVAIASVVLSTLRLGGTSGGSLSLQRGLQLSGANAKCRHLEVLSQDASAEGNPSLSFTESPLRLSFGVGDSNANGAIVGNFVLVVLSAVIKLVWVARSRLSVCCEHVIGNLARLAVEAELPGSVLWIFGFLLQPSLSSVVVQIGAAITVNGQAAAAALFGLLWTVGPPALIWVALFRSRAIITATIDRHPHPVLPKAATLFQSLTHRLSKFRKAKWLWRCQNAKKLSVNNNVVNARTFNGFRVFVEDCRFGMRYFLFADMSCSVVGGVLCGLLQDNSQPISCDALSWAMFAVCTAFLVAVVTLRPYNSAMLLFGAIANGAVTSTVVLLTILQCTDAANTLGTLQSMASVLATVMDIALRAMLLRYNGKISSWPSALLTLLKPSQLPRDQGFVLKRCCAFPFTSSMKCLTLPIHQQSPEQALRLLVEVVCDGRAAAAVLV